MVRRKPPQAATLWHRSGFPTSHSLILFRRRLRLGCKPWPEWGSQLISAPDVIRPLRQRARKPKRGGDYPYVALRIRAGVGDRQARVASSQPCCYHTVSSRYQIVIYLHGRTIRREIRLEWVIIRYGTDLTVAVI